MIELAPAKELQSTRNVSSLAPSLYETHLEAARVKDVAAHEANAAAIEHNKAMRARIEAVMKACGIPEKYSRRKPSRRYGLGKMETVESGYRGDLVRCFPISDDWSSAESAYSMASTRLAQERAQKQREREHAAGEAERKAAARRKDMALAALLVKYELDADKEWRDVLYAICKRDKYVGLAVAGQRVRVHGSDELWRVRNAMDAFTIENDMDKSIATSWAMRLSQYDDHRDFRDGEWGYDAVMLKGAPDVADDARTCLVHMGDE